MLDLHLTLYTGHLHLTSFCMSSFWLTRRLGYSDCTLPALFLYFGSASQFMVLFPPLVWGKVESVLLMEHEGSVLLSIFLSLLPLLLQGLVHWLFRTEWCAVEARQSCCLLAYQTSQAFVSLWHLCLPLNDWGSCAGDAALAVIFGGWGIVSGPHAFYLFVAVEFRAESPASSENGLYTANLP